MCTSNAPSYDGVFHLSRRPSWDRQGIQSSWSKVLLNIHLFLFTFPQTPQSFRLRCHPGLLPWSIPCQSLQSCPASLETVVFLANWSSPVGHTTLRLGLGWMGISTGIGRSGGRPTSGGSPHSCPVFPLRLTHSHRLKVQQLLIGRHFIKLGLPGKKVCSRESREWWLTWWRCRWTGGSLCLEVWPMQPLEERPSHATKEGILDSIFFFSTYLTGPASLQGAHLIFPLS